MTIRHALLPNLRLGLLASAVSDSKCRSTNWSEKPELIAKMPCFPVVSTIGSREQSG
jgi:hypothetical protein